MKHTLGQDKPRDVGLTVVPISHSTEVCPYCGYTTKPRDRVTKTIKLMDAHVAKKHPEHRA